MAITTAMVKELREKTGAGIMDAKRALEEADGDIKKATTVLHEQGLARAEKKAGRTASQGLIEPYIHGGGRIGTLIEINCETDFVARTQEFQDLAHDIAMQVAALNPQYVNVEDIPADILKEQSEELSSEKTATQQLALMAQPFIKDQSQSIQDVIKDAIAKVGENIVVRRFSRFELGETVEEDDSDDA